MAKKPAAPKRQEPSKPQPLKREPREGVNPLDEPSPENPHGPYPDNTDPADAPQPSPENPHGPYPQE